MEGTCQCQLRICGFVVMSLVCLRQGIHMFLMFVLMTTLQLKEESRMTLVIDQCVYFFKSPKAGEKNVRRK